MSTARVIVEITSALAGSFTADTDSRTLTGMNREPSEHAARISEGVRNSPTFQQALQEGRVGNQNRVPDDVVARIVAMRERHPPASWGEICRELADLGIPTVRGASSWRRSTVQTIYEAYQAKEAKP